MYVQRSSRARFTVPVLACLGLLAAGVAGAQQIAVDFSGLPNRTSVEGLGTVHPDLSIVSSKGNSIKQAPNQQQDVAYTGSMDADCRESQWINNGCMDPSGGFGNYWSSPSHTFTFAEGVTIKEFSLHMLDFGDHNPKHSTSHQMQMDAYDQSGAVVGTHLLSYTSGPGESPKQSDHGTLFCGAGDACKAQPGQPGNWTWNVQGAGIVRVELQVLSGPDPHIAFDKLTFTKETAQDKVGYLVEYVQSLGLQQGMYTALTAKLQDALTALAVGDTVTAATALQDFINQVAAQTGKKIDPTTAAQLTADATAILQSITG